MDPMIRRVAAPDGLTIAVRVWDRGANGGDLLPPILCLPGLVRTGGDFTDLAAAIGAGRRVIAPDYAGRGDSDRAANARRYGPIACLRDVMAVSAALEIRRAIVVGTSFGGLLAMGLAALRPSLTRAVVLNDIGPSVGDEGTDFVRDFVGLDPALESLDACVAFLRARLPPLALQTDEDWRRMAALTYGEGADGRYHPLWDTRIATLLGRGAPAYLWPLFWAMRRLPVLLVRGALSNILLPGTVERMRVLHPGMEIVTIPDVGHAPTLLEPDALDAVRAFLDRNR